MNIYGMRLRGFSIGCQPKEGFVDRQDDPTGKYHDILIYDRKLTDKELAEYELDYLGMEAEAMKDDLISRQAVLDWLEDEWDGMVVHVFDGIKNIPSAHCDNCPYPDQHVPQEDAVSRKELKHIFETWLTVKGYNDAERNIIKAALYELQFAPSVMPVQRSFSCGKENDMISRQDAIEAILAVTGNSSVRELYEHVQAHGLSDMWSGGVNAAIDIIIAVPSAQPEYEELTPEEAASEIASGSIMSASYWFDLMIRLKQMGYAICRKVSEQHEST